MKYPTLLFMLILSISLVSAQCIDTDGGKNKYESGSVTDQKESYADICEQENIKEYFCTIEGIASYTILPCVNGCTNAACLLANEQPKAQAPEQKESSNIQLYLYGIIIIGIIALYIYLFKWKKKKRSY